MKNRGLILITNEFPYDSGETFIENEIEYISDVFKDILIFSINGKDKQKATRTIPNNNKVVPLNNETSIFKYLKYSIKGFFVKDKSFVIRERNLLRIIASLYCRGRGYEIAKSIYEICKKNDIDTKNVTIYSYWFTYQAVAAVMLGKMLLSDGDNIKVFSRAHGYDLYWERVKGGFHPFQDVLLKCMDGCFPCSDYGRRYLLKKYPWAETKVTTKRLGTIDYGLNPYNNEKILLTCCNLISLKRISLFAKAFCILVKKNPNIKWICIGDGEERERIRDIIKKASIEDKVEMLGKLQNKEVLALYKKQGIMYFISVSTTEGVPVSVMEAQSFGVPAIATDAGGTREIVNEENGKLLPVKINVFELARQINDMINLSEGEYLKKRVASRENWWLYSAAEKVYTDFTSFIW